MPPAVKVTVIITVKNCGLNTSKFAVGLMTPVDQGGSRSRYYITRGTEYLYDELVGFISGYGFETAADM
jgi:hypothetical protein